MARWFENADEVAFCGSKHSQANSFSFAASPFQREHADGQACPLGWLPDFVKTAVFPEEQFLIICVDRKFRECVNLQAISFVETGNDDRT